jgi:hypothetical protein
MCWAIVVFKIHGNFGVRRGHLRSAPTHGFFEFVGDVDFYGFPRIPLIILIDIDHPKNRKRHP